MLRSIRNFVITLLISGAIFGLAAYFVSNILIECMGPMFGISADNVINNSKDDEDDDDKIQQGTQNDTTSSFSMLIINTNYNPSKADEYSRYDVARYPLNEETIDFTTDSLTSKKIEATDFIIIRGNSQKKEFTYTYLPASLVVTVKGVELTLNDVYRDIGVGFLCKKISAITGFNIDFYSIYDIEDVSYIIDYMNGVSYNVPFDIKKDNEILLEKGQKSISGLDAALLLEYDGYINISQRSQTIVPLIKKIMAKATNKIYKVDVIALHRSSSNKVDTSLQINDINAISELLYSYVSSNVHELSYPGKYMNRGEKQVFVPNIASAITKFVKYR